MLLLPRLSFISPFSPLFSSLFSPFSLPFPLLFLLSSPPHSIFSPLNLSFSILSLSSLLTHSLLSSHFSPSSSFVVLRSRKTWDTLLDEQSSHSKTGHRGRGDEGEEGEVREGEGEEGEVGEAEGEKGGAATTRPYSHSSSGSNLYKKSDYFQPAKFVGPISNILKKFPEGLQIQRVCRDTHMYTSTIMNILCTLPFLNLCCTSIYIFNTQCTC